MRSTFLIAALFLASIGRAQDAASWKSVFPTINGYATRFEPTVSGPQSWQQTAAYEWTGGRLETVRITLMRDAEEAKRYAPDAIKELKDAPKEVRIGERRGYLWGSKKLVVVLKDDTLLKLESPTVKQFESNLVAFAQRFDFGACLKAVEKRP